MGALANLAVGARDGWCNSTHELRLRGGSEWYGVIGWVAGKIQESQGSALGLDRNIIRGDIPATEMV